jgi:hypothetical protein
MGDKIDQIIPGGQFTRIRRSGIKHHDHSSRAEMGRQLMGHLSDAIVGHSQNHSVCTLKRRLQWNRSYTQFGERSLTRFADFDIPHGIVGAFEITGEPLAHFAACSN